MRITGRRIKKEKRGIESKRLTDALNEKIANDPFAALLKPKTEDAQAPETETAVPPVQENTQSDAQEFNQNYFTSLATDENGEFNGPFMIDFKDGRIVEASRIVNVMAEAIEIETAGDVDSIRKIRVPYSKISSCALKSNWMEGR